MFVWEDKIGLELDGFAYIPLISPVLALHMLDFLLPVSRGGSRMSQMQSNVFKQNYNFICRSV